MEQRELRLECVRQAVIAVAGNHTGDKTAVEVLKVAKLIWEFVQGSSQETPT